MSDLAPFVAAVIRDKVVTELHDEVQQLRRQLYIQQTKSQLVTITGPNGHPIYAKTIFRNGNFDYSPELWKVDFKKSTSTSAYASTAHNGNGNNSNNSNNNHNMDDDDDDDVKGRCSLSELADMEVRLGGICKARLSNGIVEGFVNDITNNYNEIQKSGVVSIWFGGSSGIWLNIRIEPIEREQYAALRAFDLEGGQNLLTTLSQFLAPTAVVSFTEVSFLISYVNGAMEHWGIPTDPSSEVDDTNDTNRNTNTIHQPQPPQNSTNTTNNVTHRTNAINTVTTMTTTTMDTTAASVYNNSIATPTSTGAVVGGGHTNIITNHHGTTPTTIRTVTNTNNNNNAAAAATNHRQSQNNTNRNNNNSISNNSNNNDSTRRARSSRRRPPRRRRRPYNLINNNNNTDDDNDTNMAMVTTGSNTLFDEDTDIQAILWNSRNNSSEI